MDTFQIALNSAVGTSTTLIAKVGAQGVKIVLATLGIAVVIIFIQIGWKKGIAAMNGQIGTTNEITRYNSEVSKLRKRGLSKEDAEERAFDW